MQSARSRERTAWGGAQQTRGRNRQCVCSVCAWSGVCRGAGRGLERWVGGCHTPEEEGRRKGQPVFSEGEG